MPHFHMYFDLTVASAVVLVKQWQAQLAVRCKPGPRVHRALVSADPHNAGATTVLGHLFVPTDVRSEQDVTQLVQEIRSKLGRLDYCMNNAGIEGERALVQDYSTETFDQVRQQRTIIERQMPVDSRMDLWFD